MVGKAIPINNAAFQPAMAYAHVAEPIAPPPIPWLLTNPEYLLHRSLFPKKLTLPYGVPTPYQTLLNVRWLIPPFNKNSIIFPERTVRYNIA